MRAWKENEAKREREKEGERERKREREKERVDYDKVAALWAILSGFLKSHLWHKGVENSPVISFYVGNLKFRNEWAAFKTWTSRFKKSGDGFIFWDWLSLLVMLEGAWFESCHTKWTQCVIEVDLHGRCILGNDSKPFLQHPHSQVWLLMVKSTQQHSNLGHD